MLFQKFRRPFIRLQRRFTLVGGGVGWVGEGMACSGVGVYFMADTGGGQRLVEFFYLCQWNRLVSLAKVAENRGHTEVVKLLRAGDSKR